MLKGYTGMIKLVEKEHCSGCTACMVCCPKEAISMCADEEGFKYPVIDRNRCVECGKCVRTCPITNKQKKNSVVDSYIAINNDKSQREASASGGLFSVIAHYVLEKNGVVFGAAYDEELRVKHTAIEHEADLEKLRMSKYVQSDLGDTFKQVDKYLKADRIVLFSGTPCQVAGLRAYINREDANLILLDLVCHGVPSPKLFEDYKTALSEKYESDIQNIYFRSKVLGHHLSTIAVRFSNGKLIHSRRLVKSYPRLWFAGFASRLSCYACSFKEEDRVSDFTLFDSFKSAGQYDFKDDDMGLSNVYVRTQKATDLWKQIEAQVTAVKTKTAVTNKNDGDMIYESAVKNKARAEFWSDYGKLSYTELIDKYIPYSKKEAIMDKVKRVMVSTGLSKNLKIKKLLTKIKK